MVQVDKSDETKGNQLYWRGVVFVVHLDPNDTKYKQPQFTK